MAKIALWALSRMSRWLMLSTLAAQMMAGNPAEAQTTVAATASKNLGITVTSSGNPTITGLSLSGTSFTGGAANNTAVGTLTVTTSNGTTPTISIVDGTGGIVGSGHDKDSFQISGGSSPFTLATHTSGGATDQAGQYQICIVASGATYTNSPQQICQTIQATGAGGTGWQLAFSDEFVCPNNMVECLNTYPVTSYTWSNASNGTTKGVGTVVVNSASVAGLSSAVCTGQNLGSCDVSIAGATNNGTVDTIVNGLFLVTAVAPNTPSSGQTTLTLYMPYNGIGTIGLGSGATLGTGPWSAAIVNSCGSGTWPACLGGAAGLDASNDNGDQEWWDPHACTEGSGILTGNLTNSGSNYLNASGTAVANYIPPTAMSSNIGGNSGSYTACSLETWNGTSGIAQVSETYIDMYAQMPAGGSHSTVWAEVTTNIWNTGPEADLAECRPNATGGFCGSSFWYPPVGANAQSPPDADHSARMYEWGMDIGNGTVAAFVDGSQYGSWTGITGRSGFSWYPRFDSTIDGSVTSPGPFPSALKVEFVRLYAKVASGACYTSIPGSTTVPHVGTC